MIYLLVSVIVLGGLVYMLTRMSNNQTDEAYSEIMQKFDDLKVSEFTLDLGSGKLTYKLRDEGTDQKHSYDKNA